MAWKTTNDPRNKFVTLRLTASEEAELLLHVKAEGHKDRSTAARDALFRVIRNDRKRRAKNKGRKS